MSKRFEGNTGQDKDEETLGSFYMGRMQPPPDNDRVLPRGLLAAIAVIIFAGVIWYAYPDSEQQYDAADVPLIKADAAPYKFAPDDPGGMEVRHQDSTIFDPLAKKPVAEVEHLLPKPEEPLNKQDVIQTKVPAVKDASEVTAAPPLNLEPLAEETGAEKVVLKEEPAKPATLTELAMAPAEEKPAEPAPSESTPAQAAASVAAPAVVGGFYMQLGAFRDAAKAKEEWRKLQKKFPQSLSSLDLRVEKTDLAAKGIWYRLYAGPLAEAKARDVCSRLKSDNASGCIVRKL